MRLSRFQMIAVAAAFAMTASFAKAPVGATGQCKDDSYTKADKREGACSSHGGVKEWFGKAKAAAAERPNDATGQCKDGTYTSAATRAGACSGHDGVKEWFGGSSKAAAPAKEKASATKTTSRAAPAPEDRPSTAQRRPTDATGTDRATNPQPRPTVAAAGGGAGKVWVNTDSKVYHCEADAYYGKTKQGEYMSEARAKASGARASRGKECS
jgi:hypothetical protein